MSAISTFVTEFVAPVARQAGFERNGQGFRRSDVHGNVVSLRVSKGRHAEFDGPESAELAVFERLSLPEAVSYIYDGAAVEAKTLELRGEVYGHLVAPPADARYGSERYDEYWIFRDRAERDRKGPILAAILRDDVFPRLLALLEDGARSQPRYAELLPRDGYRTGLSPFIVDVLSGMQGGPHPQLVEAWIAEADRGGNSSLVAWLRERLPSG